MSKFFKVSVILVCLMGGCQEQPKNESFGYQLKEGDDTVWCGDSFGVVLTAPPDTVKAWQIDSISTKGNTIGVYQSPMPDSDYYMLFKAPCPETVFVHDTVDICRGIIRNHIIVSPDCDVYLKSAMEAIKLMSKTIDSLRSTAPPCTVYVYDTVNICEGDTMIVRPHTVYVTDTVYVYDPELDSHQVIIERIAPCLYPTEAEVCKVRGHDLTHLIGWNDFDADVCFKCWWCGAEITREIIRPPIDTIYKEVSPPTK